MDSLISPIVSGTLTCAHTDITKLTVAGAQATNGYQWQLLRVNYVAIEPGPSRT